MMAVASCGERKAETSTAPLFTHCDASQGAPSLRARGGWVGGPNTARVAQEAFFGFGLSTYLPKLGPLVPGCTRNDHLLKPKSDTTHCYSSQEPRAPPPKIVLNLHDASIRVGGF